MNYLSDTRADGGNHMLYYYERWDECVDCHRAYEVGAEDQGRCPECEARRELSNGEHVMTIQMELHGPKYWGVGQVEVAYFNGEFACAECIGNDGEEFALCDSDLRAAMTLAEVRFEEDVARRAEQ